MIAMVILVNYFELGFLLSDCFCFLCFKSFSVIIQVFYFLLVYIKLLAVDAFTACA